MIFVTITAAMLLGGAPPSLAKRPVEDRGMAEPMREVAPPAPADAALQTQIAGLVEKARGGQRAFADLLPRARAAAAGAGSEGSESWIAAQLLLSALEDARAASTQALSELDSTIALRLNGGSDAGLTELQAADIEAAALADAQQRELDSLRGRLSR
jgi:hypothetical protein